MKPISGIFAAVLKALVVHMVAGMSHTALNHLSYPGPKGPRR